MKMRSTIVLDWVLEVEISAETWFMPCTIVSAQLPVASPLVQIINLPMYA